MGGGIMVKTIEKPLSINPLKKSQIMGAVSVFLGIEGCMPLVHGSQGCMAFTKNFLTQHFREVTPMQSTAVFDIATILGGDSNLHDGLKNVIEKTKPKIIGLCTSGMTETRGDDIKGTLLRFREQFPEFDETVIVPVLTPDFVGDAETGYAEAVAQILNVGVDVEAKKTYKDNRRINILAGMHLNAADIDWLRRLFADFGLDTFVLPDLASTMGGQVTRFYSLPEEGSKLEDIKTAGCADFTIAVGSSMEKAADVLLEKCSVPYKKFDTLTGVKATDELLSWLMDYTGKPVPEWVKIERKRALDAMLDAHFSFGGKTCSIAAEPDLAYNLGKMISEEFGIKLETIVSTAKEGLFTTLDAENIICGDMEDLEDNIGKSDFVIANSNAGNICHRKGLPLYKAGYPIKDMLGHFHRHFIGYKGAMMLAFDLGNICLEKDIHSSH
jgi:nitrogenase molybdenum-iron cofactor biosynthesis protein NifN